MSKDKTTIELRQEKNKQDIVEQLKKTPVVEIACKKVGVGRSTYYRWRKEDKVFAQVVEESLEIGSSLISDMAESQLIKAIQDGNMTGIIFWLKNHHPTYANKLELTAKVKDNEELTPEQKEIVKQALQLASLTNTEQHEQDTKKIESTGNNSADDQKQKHQSSHN